MTKESRHLQLRRPTLALMLQRRHLLLLGAQQRLQLGGARRLRLRRRRRRTLRILSGAEQSMGLQSSYTCNNETFHVSAGADGCRSSGREAKVWVTVHCGSCALLLQARSVLLETRRSQ
jgi:hypothetical protein